MYAHQERFLSAKPRVTLNTDKCSPLCYYSKPSKKSRSPGRRRCTELFRIYKDAFTSSAFSFTPAILHAFLLKLFFLPSVSPLHHLELYIIKVNNLFLKKILLSPWSWGSKLALILIVYIILKTCYAPNLLPGTREIVV